MNKNKFFNKTAAVWFLAALCCLLWGSAFPAIKIGYSLFDISSDDTSSIILFAGLRFTLAGLITIIIFSIMNKKILLPSKSSLPKIGVLSLFQTIIQYIFFYLGLAHISGDMASIINGTSVFFALIISALIFKTENITLKKVVGCVIGFVGVLLVSMNAFNQQNFVSLSGEIFILISTVSYAFSSAFMKKYSDSENPAMLSAYQFVFGGFVMTVYGIVSGGKIHSGGSNGIMMLIYLAFVSAIAYTIWSVLLKYNPVSKVAVCGFMTPVFGFILSLLFFDNSSSVGISAFVALILVVIGMIIVNLNSKQNKK